MTSSRTWLLHSGTVGNTINKELGRLSNCMIYIEMNGVNAVHIVGSLRVAAPYKAAN